MLIMSIFVHIDCFDYMVFRFLTAIENFPERRGDVWGTVNGSGVGDIHFFTSGI